MGIGMWVALAKLYQYVTFSKQTETMPKQRLVGVNERGRRVGEDHPRAIFSNHDIELMHRLIEEGVTHRRIAEIMECGIDQVKSVACGRRRGQHATGFKKIG